MPKKFTLALFLWFAFAAGAVRALPLVQHSLSGIVRSIDIDKGLLTLEPGKKDAPTEFVVVGGRTKLRRNKQPAALTDLVVGQAIHVYYKREMGRYVATEVNWTCPPGTPSAESKPSQ